MKKLLQVSLLVLFVLFQFSSCNKGKTVQMKNITYSNKLYLNNTDTALGALIVNIDMEIPNQYFNDEILSNIRKQIVSKVFGEQYVTLPIDTIVPNYVAKLYENYLQDYDKEFQLQVKNSGGPSMTNEIKNEGISMFSDDKILSYSYESYAYLGGAHGNSNRRLYNFDLKNAHIITENEIFISDYFSTLTQFIKEELLEQSAEVGSVADLNDLDFWEEEIRPNNNFYVSEEGLVYVFNPYEIAPYSMGQIEVTLPYDKLKPLMKSGNILEYLYNNVSKK